MICFSNGGKSFSVDDAAAVFPSEPEQHAEHQQYTDADAADRADQTDRQHDGGGGTLDHRGDQRTGDHAHNNVTGNLLKNPLQCRAGAVFQTVAHQFDAIKEHGQAAKQLDNGT